MIEIKKFNRKELDQYVNSDEFKESSVIPISFHRAVSQINNPRAQDEDILLFVASEDHKMVGYLGALPDDYFTKDNAKIHLAWMSCLWVDPVHRGKKIAQKLILSCFEAWDNRIILTEFTAEAGNLYQKMNLFDPWLELKGRRWYIQSDLSFILPPKHNLFRKIKPLLEFVDQSVNTIINLSHIFNHRSTILLDEVTKLTNLDPSIYVVSHDSSGFLRSAQELHWLLKYPWVLEGENEKESNKYHFTSYSKQFHCNALTVKDATGKICGFILYTLRNGHLKIPYHSYQCPMNHLSNTILEVIKKYKVKTMTLYSQDLIVYLMKNKSLKSFSKEIRRKYLISKTLSPLMPFHESTIYDGDGDCGFT